MSITFLMAAGKGTRWRRLKESSDLPDIKQLLQIDGMPLIRTTVDKLNFLEVNYLLVTAEPEIVVACECSWITPRQGRQTLLSNIYHTYQFPGWSGRVTFLLGDVVYTWAALIHIFQNHQEDYLFFGNQLETFALSINPSGYDKILDAISHVSAMPAKSKKRHIRYRLKDIRWYLLTGDCPHDYVNEFASRKRDKNFYFINDGTCDIDHELAYRRFLKGKRGGDIIA